MRRLGLGLFLIVGPSSVLLISNLNQRHTGSREMSRIAIFQHASAARRWRL
ncbi:MAG: hypothetical protein ACRD5L_00360 [Bryobacteraceae bacterium]